LQTTSTVNNKKIKIWINKCFTFQDVRCKDLVLKNTEILISVISALNTDYANDTYGYKFSDYWLEEIPLEYSFVYKLKKLLFGKYQLTTDFSILPRSFFPPDVINNWFYLDTQDRE
jgi:hypothetical protein